MRHINALREVYITGTENCTPLELQNLSGLEGHGAIFYCFAYFCRLSLHLLHETMGSLPCLRFFVSSMYDE